MAGALPDIASLTQYGGPWVNYSPVVDPTTDVPDFGLNVIAETTAQMTHTAIRAWVRLGLLGTAAPTLLAHDAVWGNSPGIAPTLVRASTGVVTISWPATVQDEIPSTSPGGVSGHALNLRGCWQNLEIGATTLSCFASTVVTAPNTVSIYTYGGANATTFTDISGFNLQVFAL